MSKLFTPRALLIQLMLYLIAWAISSLIKSEMKTSEISGKSSYNLIYQSGGSTQVEDARRDTQELLNAINGQ